MSQGQTITGGNFSPGNVLQSMSGIMDFLEKVKYFLKLPYTLLY
jgi:hypothetical protein